MKNKNRKTNIVIPNKMGNLVLNQKQDLSPDCIGFEMTCRKLI